MCLLWLHVNHAMLLSDLNGPRKYVGWILYTHFLLVEGDHYYICNGIDGCCNCLVNHTCVKANIKVCTLGIHKRSKSRLRKNHCIQRTNKQCVKAMTHQGATIGPTRWKSCHAGCAQASVASSSGVESSCLRGMHFACGLVSHGCGLVSHGCCGGGGEDKLLLGLAPNKLLGDEAGIETDELLGIDIEPTELLAIEPGEALGIEPAELLGIEPRGVGAK